MGKMSLSIYMKGDYEEFHALKAAKNKANSKPNKAKQSQFVGGRMTARGLGGYLEIPNKANFTEGSRWQKRANVKNLKKYFAIGLKTA